MRTIGIIGIGDSLIVWNCEGKGWRDPWLSTFGEGCLEGLLSLWRHGHGWEEPDPSWTEAPARLTVAVFKAGEADGLPLPEFHGADEGSDPGNVEEGNVRTLGMRDPLRLAETPLERWPVGESRFQRRLVILYHRSLVCSGEEQIGVLYGRGALHPGGGRLHA